MTRSHIAVELKNVHHNYGKRELLSNINFNFKNERKYSIIGSNGVGKSTLLSIISGINQPTSGEIFVNSKAISELDHTNKHHYLNYQPQFSHFQKNIRVSEILSLFHKLYSPVKNYRELKDIIESDMYDTYYGKLSGGEAGILNLYLNLLSDAPILLLDEPTANIDIYITDVINKILSNEKRTVIFTSHNIHTIYEASDNILFLNNFGLYLLPEYCNRDESISLIKLSINALRENFDSSILTNIFHIRSMDDIYFINSDINNVSNLLADDTVDISSEEMLYADFIMDLVKTGRLRV